MSTFFQTEIPTTYSHKCEFLVELDYNKVHLKEREHKITNNHQTAEHFTKFWNNNKDELSKFCENISGQNLYLMVNDFFSLFGYQRSPNQTAFDLWHDKCARTETGQGNYGIWNNEVSTLQSKMAALKEAMKIIHQDNEEIVPRIIKIEPDVHLTYKKEENLKISTNIGIVENYLLTICQGDLRLGAPIESIDLAPGEERTIRVKEWEIAEQLVKKKKKFLQSFKDVKSLEDLSERKESTTNRRSKTSELRIGVSGKIGVVEAKTEGSIKVAKERNHAVEDLKRTIMKHNTETIKSSEKEIEEELKTISGTEMEDSRVLRNNNTGTTINYIIKSIDQEFHIVTELTGIELVAYNSVEGIFDSSSIHDVNSFCKKYFDISNDNTIEKYSKEIKNIITSNYSNIKNYSDNEVKFIEEVGDKFVYTYQQEQNTGVAISINKKRKKLPTNGLHTKYIKIVRPTGSVFMDSLLGTNSALDDYGQKLQINQNARTEAETGLIIELKNTVQELLKDGKNPELAGKLLLAYFEKSSKSED